MHGRLLTLRVWNVLQATNTAKYFAQIFLTFRDVTIFFKFVFKNRHVINIGMPGHIYPVCVLIVVQLPTQRSPKFWKSLGNGMGFFFRLRTDFCVVRFILRCTFHLVFAVRTGLIKMALDVEQKVCQ